MLDINEGFCVLPGARIKYHPKEGDPFVIEAVEPEEGAMVCEGCLFNDPDAPGCFEIPCCGGELIWRAVPDAAAAKTSVQK